MHSQELREIIRVVGKPQSALQAQASGDLCCSPQCPMHKGFAGGKKPIVP